MKLLFAPAFLLVATYVIAGSFWIALGIAALMITCASLSVAIMRGALLDDRDAELERREREHAAEVADLKRDNADLIAALAESTATLADARVVIPLKPVAGPNVIPMQRDGHLPLSSEEWDAIQRETEWPS